MSEFNAFKKCFDIMFPEPYSPERSTRFGEGLVTTFSPVGDRTLLVAEDLWIKLAKVIDVSPCPSPIACSHDWFHYLPRDSDQIDISTDGDLVEFSTTHFKRTRVLVKMAVKNRTTHCATPVMSEVGELFIKALIAAAEIDKSTSARSSDALVNLNGRRGTICYQYRSIGFGGFDFPWPEHIVSIYPSDIYAAFDLDATDHVSCGILGSSLIIAAGPWTLVLPYFIQSS